MLTGIFFFFIRVFFNTLRDDRNKINFKLINKIK